MLNKLYKFLDRILQVNFKTCNFKYVYLYNEVFISIICNKKFIFIWISLKANKLLINKYFVEDILDIKKLLALIKKYEEYFKQFLKELQKNSNNIWYESDFINIFDKKELNYEKVKEILNFSFLDDYTFRRRSEMDFNFEEKSELSIYHSDFECSRCSWPIESFTNFPDFRNQALDERYFKSIENNKKYTSFVTNITDYESISIWGNKKINEILSNKKLIDEHELISINKTCISVIMWDDIKSVLKYNNIPLEKTIYTDQNIDSWYRVVINFLKKLNLNKNIKKVEEIVFFWLNKNKNTYELIKFLKDNFNIKVWNILLPNINKEDLENIFKYKFAVFFRWKEVKTQEIFKLYPIDNFEIKVPYSLENNFSLYKSILEQYWKKSELKKLKNIFDDLKEKKKNLFKKAEKYEIWFIIFDFHIEKFLKDNFRWVDILQMLENMWFKINFFVYNFKDSLEDFQKLKEKYNNSIISNSSLDLENFIKNDSIWLYYSEINRDKRILDKNKEIFSIWDLEYWINWFFRTFKKLIKKCEKVDYLKSI